MTKNHSTKRLTTDEFIENSKRIHKDKYDYSKTIYKKNNHQKVIIICPLHGEFQQQPNCHLSGRGCPYCGNHYKLDTTSFIEKSKKVHGDKYDYSLINYINCENNVEIICPKHGIFLQQPYKHIAGRGCIKCRNQKTGDLRRSSLKQFITKSRAIHKNKYDYSNSIYKTDKIKVEIRCPTHKKFYQTPNMHLKGQGCPKCRNRISKSESEFLNYLKIDNRQYRIRKFNVDGYDNKTKTVYEFLGDYFHGNPCRFKSDEYNKTCKKSFGKLYRETFYKFKTLKILGHNIKYIWEEDWNKFKKGIDKSPKILTYI